MVASRAIARKGRPDSELGCTGKSLLSWTDENLVAGGALAEAGMGASQRVLHSHPEFEAALPESHRVGEGGRPSFHQRPRSGRPAAPGGEGLDFHRPVGKANPRSAKVRRAQGADAIASRVEHCARHETPSRTLCGLVDRASRPGLHENARVKFRCRDGEA
jgi:hypothetical protein